MDKLAFDTQGNLTPYEVIETDWQTFVETFAWNEPRQLLIETLQTFLFKLNELAVKNFILWIDGSFVTQKEHPNDLDLVVVLPSQLYRQFEKELRLLRDQFSRLDVYFVRMIDENASDHFLYVSDRTEWLFQFTMTKPNRVTRRKFPKGFLQIIWDNESTS